MRSNQRVVRQVLPSGATYDGIYEVYYDDDGTPVSRSEQLSTLLAPTARGLVAALSEVRAAFDRPILLELNDRHGRFVELSHEKGDMT